MTGGPDPELDNELLDALLSRAPLPPGAPDRAHAAAEMLARLADPAQAGELAGEDAARTAFVRAARRRGPPTPLPRARRRPSRLRARISLRLAAVLATLAMLLGGTVAAYAGALPDPVQKLAHAAIGAPAPRNSHGHVTRHRAARPAPSPAPTAAGRGKSPGAGTPKGPKEKGKAKGHKKTAKQKKAKKPKKAHKVKKPKKNAKARGQAAAPEV